MNADLPVEQAPRKAGRPAYVHVLDAVRMAWTVNPAFNRQKLASKLKCHRDTIRKYVRQVEAETPEDARQRLAVRFSNALDAVVGQFAKNVFEGVDDMTDAQRAQAISKMLTDDQRPLVAVQVNTNSGDDALVRIAEQRGIEVSPDFGE